MQGVSISLSISKLMAFSRLTSVTGNSILDVAGVPRFGVSDQNKKFSDLVRYSAYAIFDVLE